MYSTYFLPGHGKVEGWEKEVRFLLYLIVLVFMPFGICPVVTEMFFKAFDTLKFLELLKNNH